MTLQKMIGDHHPRPWKEKWKRPSFLKTREQVETVNQPETTKASKIDGTV
jgi:hypothetical protein